MPSIGSNLPSVQSSFTSSVGGPPDITDDGGDVDSAPAAPPAPADRFDAGPAKPTVEKPSIANVTTPTVVDPNKFAKLHVDVPWMSQDSKSDDYDKASKGNCNATCKDMMKSIVSDEYGGAVASGSDHIIPSAPMKDGKIATDANGRLLADAALASKGQRYIDGQLEEGHPVMVGVNRKDGAPKGNSDGVTDHFVVITGRDVDEQGRLFYTFHDPAARSEDNGSGDKNENNRFYVDQKTGLLYRDGTDGNQAKIDGKANANYHQRYEVSQVRVNTLVSPALDLSKKD